MQRGAVAVWVCGGLLVGGAGCAAVEERSEYRQAQQGGAPVVAASANEVSPVEAGATAPVAAVRDSRGEPVGMDEVYSDGPTVLIFYRGGWCPYCSEHLSEVAHESETLRALGFRIVGVSADRPDRLPSEREQGEKDYRLLSDNDMRLSRAFGLAFRVDEETRASYREMGLDLEAHSGRGHGMLPVPAIYLIDGAGVVRFAHWDADYRERLDIEDLLAAAEEIGS